MSSIDLYVSGINLSHVSVVGDLMKDNTMQVILERWEPTQNSASMKITAISNVPPVITTNLETWWNTDSGLSRK